MTRPFVFYTLLVDILEERLNIFLQPHKSLKVNLGDSVYSLGVGDNLIQIRTPELEQSQNSSIGESTGRLKSWKPRTVRHRHIWL